MACPTPAYSSPKMHSEIEIEMAMGMECSEIEMGMGRSEIEMEMGRSSPAATRIDSSSASSSSNVADPMVYDVFINHRGPDTKKTFAGHLYSRLSLHGFRVFLDQPELEGGLKFPFQIESAIKTASVQVAIFSPTYTDSPWCLEELLHMQESGAPIIPIFYKVKPSDLRHGEALHKLKMKKNKTDVTQPRYDAATIENWRNALYSVAEISGFDLDGAFSGDENRMLDKVVECVLKRVKKTKLHVAKYPIGLDEKVKAFETTVLKRHQYSEKVQVLGIVGLGGMGKTTLALELFNRMSSKYNKSYFLANVRENARSSSLHSLQGKVLRGSSSLHSLQGKVLRGLTQLDMNIDHIYEGTGMLKRYLQSSHVLLILDDIDDEDQLDAFLPIKDAIRSDSLILITCRDRDVLRKSGVEDASIYKITGLSPQHSRDLFCSYAFSQPDPLRGFEDLVDKFLMACKGLPLSLKVFGALLREKNDKFWEDTLSEVQKVPHDIEERLKISYDALSEEEKQIFLDIACFFIREKRDVAVGIWDTLGWKGSSSFQNLKSKCLVEVDRDNCIHMHDHLRDMAQKIALDKLPRRLCHPKRNIEDLLQQSSVITEVRGIRTLFSQDMNGHHETLSRYQRKSPALFRKWVTSLSRRLHTALSCSHGIAAMNLQLLQTEGHLLKSILRRVHSPNLTWLSWRDCPYSYLPSWIPVKKLRVLKVEGKVLETLWQRSSLAPFELRELHISGILSEIPKSIGQLEQLERIFFRNVFFEKLPEEFCNMRSLKVLVFEGCSKLELLPDSVGNLKSLQYMELSGCGCLKGLPKSFGNLTNLQHIKLSGCQSLETLPESFGNLTNLQHMELSECQSLERLAESFGNLTNLQHMELSGCGSLVRLPESFGNLRNLQHMSLSLLSNRLHFEEVQDISLFPNGVSFLDSPLVLGALPQPFDFPLGLGGLPQPFASIERLKELPKSFGNLTKLQYMSLSGAMSLKRLPESFCNLTNLQHLSLSMCRSLERLPEAFHNLTKLQHLSLLGCESLQTLPESLDNLSNLQYMDLSECQSLERLPSIKTLVLLEELRASHCVELKSIHGLAHLTKLKELCVDGCINLEELEGVEHCRSLVKLNTAECPLLK